MVFLGSNSDIGTVFAEAAIIDRCFMNFVVGAFVAGLIQGLALGAFGAFQDSSIYFDLYQIVADQGVQDAFLGFVEQTGKYEPILFLLFSVESILSGNSLTEYSFLIVNMVLLNVLVGAVMFTSFKADPLKKKYTFTTGLIVMSGYLVFSKELYFWRNIISFCFFILFVNDASWRRSIWFIAAVLAHASAALFIPLFLLIELVARLNNRYVYWVAFAGLAAVTLVLPQFSEIIGFAASSGDASIYLEAGGAHTIKVWLSVLFSLLVLLLVYREYMTNNVLRPLYVFCLATVVVSLLSYESYHFMNRIFLPASLIVGFLPFLIEGDRSRSSTVRINLARLCIVISVLPTIRLLTMMFVGDFSPA